MIDGVSCLELQIKVIMIDVHVFLPAEIDAPLISDTWNPGCLCQLSNTSLLEI